MEDLQTFSNLIAIAALCFAGYVLLRILFEYIYKLLSYVFLGIFYQIPRLIASAIYDAKNSRK